MLQYIVLFNDMALFESQYPAICGSNKKGLRFTFTALYQYLVPSFFADLQITEATWSSWTSWSPCIPNAKCGQGVQSRHRFCQKEPNRPTLLCQVSDFLNIIIIWSTMQQLLFMKFLPMSLGKARRLSELPGQSVRSYTTARKGP